jgi:DNA-directed RNA polymerase subunit L
MEIKILSNKKNELEIEVIGEKTILNPLKYKLLDDNKVTLADWRIDHPLLTNPRFFLKVKEGKPKTILLKAIRSLKKDADTLRKSIEELKE